MQKNVIKSWDLRKFVLVALAVACTLGVGSVTLLKSLENSTNDARVHLIDQRMIFEAAIKNKVERVSLALEILVLNKEMKTLLKNTSLKEAQTSSNLILKTANEQLQSLDIFLMDRNGLTVSASNFDRPKTFIGHNYGFRPYFKDAVETGNGQFLAIGVTSGILGQYMARAVYDEGDVIGVMVIKIDLAPLRSLVSGETTEFLVFDKNNIVFLSSNREYEFRFKELPNPEARARIMASRQYPFATLDILDARKTVLPHTAIPTVEIWQRNHLVDKSNLDAFDWTIWMILPAQPILNQSYLLSFVAMVTTVVSIVLFSLLSKQRNQLQRFQVAVDNLPSGLTLFDEHLNLQMLNRNFMDILGFPEKFFKDHLPTLDKLIEFNLKRGEYGEGDTDEFIKQARARVITQKVTISERTRPNGRIVEIRSRWLDKNGFVSTYTDITDRKKAEETAKRNAHYLTTLLENLDQGISVTDENLNVVYWNKAFFDLLELPEHLMKPDLKYREIIQYNALRGDYGPGDPEQHVSIRMQTALKFKPHHFERQRNNGQTIEVTGKPLVMDGKTIGFLATYRDITDNKRLLTSMEKLAATDSLTGVINRRNFTDKLVTEIKRCSRSGQSLCLLILDLDHFKAINDTFGHSMGDEALREFANTCLNLLRAGDLMGRLGGEQFGIILPDTERDGAFTLAERIRSSVELIRLKTEQDQTVRITVSVGVSVHDNLSDKETPEKLMQRADTALYQAKNLGRNQVR